MKKLVSLFCCITTYTCYSQLNVTNNSTANTLAQVLAGSNISVFNATISGNSAQSGLFGYGGNVLDASSGVILSTGRATDAEGSNNSESTSTSFGGAGDATLSAISGENTYDAVELQFDFIVQSDYIEFSYIFASEEYNEYVNSGFNDVFGFFISGPGISGEENLALVPTTTDGVTINTINNNSYWQFYNDNQSGMLTNEIQYDGFTTLLKAIKSGLLPCETYTLRLVIADASDSALDSGVFLQENSLIQGTVAAVTQTPNADDTALEGCIKASFTFSLDQAQSFDTEICYDIKGNATNGVDYSFIDNCITIPAGQTSVTIFIDAYADGLAEGQEDIYLIYSPIPCAEKDTVFLYIDDAQPIDFTLDGVNLTCNGDNTGQIDAAITGGFSPYVITITSDSGSGTSTTYSSTDLPITGLAAGTYLVEIDDIYGCNGEAEIIGAIYDTGATFLPDGNGNVYTTTINVTGISNATMTSPDEIQSICLNMEHSFLGDVEMKLIAPDGTELILKERFNAADGNSCDLGEPVAKAPKDGAGSSNTDPGIGWDYCFTPTPNYGTMVDESDNYTRTYTDPLGRTYNDNYLPAGAYTPYQPFDNLIGVPLNGDWTIWVKDHLPQDNGWIFNWSISFKSNRPGDIITLTEPNHIDITLAGGVTQASCNGSDGAIDIDVIGDFPSFIFQWNDPSNSTTEDVSGLFAGTYTVIVTDNNGCNNNASFNVANATGPTITGVIQNEQCENTNDGALGVTITTSGSITNISWSNGATTEDISGLSPGDYTIEATDNAGCVGIETFTINEAQLISISGIVTNEKCGNKDGAIDISVSGGSGSFTYLWSNGETTEDISYLNQNTYTVTITDANGCQKQASFDVINEVGQCAPNCDLAINTATVINETCGQSDGSISLSIFTSNSPHTVSWSNGIFGDSNFNLSAGVYTATISDIEGCEIIQDYTVLNNAGNLVISNSVISDENCGQSNGAININVSGGDGNYTYAWSNSANTQDVSGLSADDYTIVVTDGTGCSVSATYTINNNTGTMGLSFQYVVDEVCGNSKGSIDINITPSGSYSYSWNTGQTTQDLKNISAGDYFCVITNNSTGCKLTTPIYTVNNDAGTLNIDKIYTTNETCGSSNGRIELDVSGGNPSYTYIWSNGGSTTEVLENLNAGTYSCAVSDQNGCLVNTGDITIQNTPGDMSVQIFKTNEVCGDAQGSIMLEVTGGSGNYTYTWSNGGTTETISNLSADAYTYIIEDDNGCVISSSVLIENSPGTLQITGAIITDTDCATNNGAVDITVAGGDGNYTYNWSNGATGQDLNSVSVGSYTITLEDGAGCSVSSTYTVNGIIQLSSSTIEDDICNAGIGSVNITLSGGTGYSFNWSNGSTNQNLTNVTQGTYTVNVTSQEGCTYTGDFIVGNSNNCATLCSTETTSINPSGTFFDSGGETGNYANGENCSFLIQPPCADEITLSFNSFSTESGFDYLRVYDGIDATGTLLLSYAGSTIPSPVTAYSGSMYIVFTSDGSVVYSGFEATWTTVQSASTPIADFSASNTNPAFGEVVNFTDLSTGNVVSWSWDVDGDGTEDYNTQNPSHAYTAAGTYTVTLTVVDCNGNTSTRSITITVQSPPQIDVTPTSFNVTIDNCEVETVTFVISNTGGGDLLWNLGSSFGNLSDDFETATFNPNLWSNIVLGTVTNSGCGSNSGSYSLYFNGSGSRYAETNPLDASLSTTFSFYLNINSCGDNAEAGEEIVLEYSTNSGTSWTTINTYNVNSYNGFTSISETVPAGAQTTNTIFRIRQLSNSGSGFDNWSVDDAFIDNVAVSSFSSPFTFSPTNGTIAPGGSTTVTVTIPPYDLAGTYTETITVSSNDPVNPEIDVTFNITQTSDCIYVMCNDTQSVQPSGTLTDSGGATGNYNYNENCSFLIQPPCADEITLSFDEFYSPTSYDYMNVYDGADATGTLIGSFAYITSPPASVTAYSGSMFITWISNSSSNYSGFVANWTSIQNLTTPFADFSVSNTNPVFGELVSFTDLSTGGVASWSWDVDGDGTEDYNTQNPSHTYTTAGTYTATLTVVGCDGSTDTYSITIIVQGEPDIVVTPATTYNITIDNCNSVTQVFTISNIGAGDLIWDIGGSYSDVSDDFETSTFNPNLWSDISLGTVTSAGCGSNSGSYALYFDGSGNRYAETDVFDATLSTDLSFYLNFLGCGDNAETGEEIVLEYSTNGGGTWTTINTYGVNAFNGFALVNEPIPAGAKTTNTIFRIRQLSNSGSGFDNWSIDDMVITNVKAGGTSTNLTFSPTNGTVAPSSSVDVTITINPYNQSGTYTEVFTINSNDPDTPSINITLNITQTSDCINIMCTDTQATSLSGVLYDSGGATGNYANSENCSFLIQPPCADEITLSFDEFYSPTSYDYMNVYDGADATGTLIGSFAYITSPPASVTAYSGSMFITWISNSSSNYSGFEATWTTVQSASTPIAGFSASTTNPVLGETINFTDLSTGGVVSWSWDVDGDGIEDYNAQNPSHIYTTQGTYTVTLTVSGCGGATDTYSITIVVQGPPIVEVTPQTLNVDITGCNAVSEITRISNIGDADLNWNIASTETITDDFESGTPNTDLWQSIAGGTVTSSGCGAVLGTRSVYFDGNTTRNATTNALNTTQSTTVSFYMNFLGCGDNAETGEEIVLEYSTNGGTSWTNISIIDVNSYNGFGLVNAPIPSGAKTTATLFRLSQLSNSGSGFDNWSIDDFSIDNISTSSSSLSNNITANPTSGVLSSGSSQDITITISPYAQAGTYTEQIIIYTNDPVNPTVTVSITITQTEDCLFSLCNNQQSTKLSGILTDSGGESANYANNETCEFLVYPTCVEEIILSFNEFRTESSYDVLYIYDGMDDTGTLLLSHSGNSIPADVIANSGAMFIRFISDGKINHEGFSATWTTTAKTNPPVADFTYSNANPVVNEIVNFTSTSSGTITSWEWNFDDGGGIISSENPSRSFSFEGCYDVTLTVKDGYTCESSVTKELCVVLEEEIPPTDTTLIEPEPLPLAIYPNPTTGIVGIDLTSKEFELIVYNVLGERVNYGLNKLNDYQYVVDISQLSRATYIFKLNGQAYKIVKMD